VSPGPVRDFDFHPDESDLLADVLVRADAARSGRPPACRPTGYPSARSRC
jgi:hypothetical protein